MKLVTQYLSVHHHASNKQLMNPPNHVASLA